MPYINADEKSLLDGGSVPQTVGHLTYLLYRATLDWDAKDDQEFWTSLGHRVQRFITRNDEPPRYQDYAVVLGAVYSTALEYERKHPADGKKALAVYGFGAAYYRVVVAPYEDTKIEQNGDVV
jgi:hypothetical protein